MTAPTTIEALLARTDRLYTAPAVAVEVMRLTDQPEIDARGLCECIQGDPALAAKVLRVVNSSLYGLPSKVGNLPQAIALLGVQPLKLLVLGFALPERLFDGLRGAELRQYWSETLTTATAAQAIAGLGWGRLGDEAFVIGLMQGIGRLALLSQLGEDYAALLAAAESRRPSLGRLPLEPVEREALGFDHRELSAALVRRWGLPENFADAIDRQGRPADELDSLEGDEACLSQSLWLASRLSRLVVGRELGVLGELLEWGGRWCGLNHATLNSLVGKLRTRVEQIAHAMSVELRDEQDYLQVLSNAHAMLATAAQRAAIQMLRGEKSDADLDEDQRLCEGLLREAHRLSAAVRDFLADDDAPDPPRPAHGATDAPRRPHCVGPDAEEARERVVRQADAAVIQCRRERQSISLAVLAVCSDDEGSPASVVELHEWLSDTHWADDLAFAGWAPLQHDRCAVLLPGLDRHDANRLWSAVSADASREIGLVLNVGLAGVTNISRGFEAELLVESAERCLAAAVDVAGASVKSLELF